MCSFFTEYHQLLCSNVGLFKFLLELKDKVKFVKSQFVLSLCQICQECLSHKYYITGVFLVFFVPFNLKIK